MKNWREFKEAEAETLRRVKRIISENPSDICYCGDYRKDHPDNGPCNLNGLGHGTISSDEWEDKCLRFRLESRKED